MLGTCLDVSDLFNKIPPNIVTRQIRTEMGVTYGNLGPKHKDGDSNLSGNWDYIMVKIGINIKMRMG